MCEPLGPIVHNRDKNAIAQNNKNIIPAVTGELMNDDCWLQHSRKG